MPNYFFSVFIFILLLSPSLAEGQYLVYKDLKKKDLERYEEARKQKFKSPDQAAQIFSKLIEKNPLLIDAYIELGSIYYYQRDFDRSLDSYHKAYQIDSVYNVRLTQSMGLAAWNAGKYDEAVKYTELYISSEQVNQQSVKDAEQVLVNAKFAQNAIKNPVGFAPERLNDEVNTPNPEYLPSISIDGTEMLFHRRVNNQEDFYTATWDDSVGWQNVRPVADLNTKANEGAHSLSADGMTLYFTLCDFPANFGSCDIYYSLKTDKGWSIPINLGPSVNSKYWDSQPSLSADGRFLIFSSDRPGGQGNRDLYVCFKTKSGKWSNPRNLGEVINSKGDDEAPFFHPDGMTLYFMSDGHPGMGSSDLFLSKTNDFKGWSTPLNLGYPINTRHKEGAIFVTTDGSTAYFAKEYIDSSGRANHVLNNIDIYMFQMPDKLKPNPVSYLQAQIVDKKTNRPLLAEIQLKSLETNNYNYLGATLEDGKILVALPAGQKLGMFIDRKDYVYHSEHFYLNPSHSYHAPYNMIIGLTPIEEHIDGTEETLVLKNVLFETNSHQIQKLSYFELDKLVLLLNTNPNISVHIIGHTDNVGASDYNLDLSEKRAQEIFQYLVDKGNVSSDRITYEGLGDEQPIGDNSTEEGRAENRRVEAKLIRR